jgi:integral membrane protein
MSFPAITISTFRKLALLEATSFIALLVGSVLKRTSDVEVLVTVLGPLHGILFVAYVGFAIGLRRDAGWTGVQTAWILIGAVLPFGGYVVDWWLGKRDNEAEPEPARS